MPIVLHAGGAQLREPMPIDQTLPNEELLDRQGVSAASFFEREQPPTNSGHDLGFAANGPPRSRRWQVGDRQRAATGPEDILLWAVRFGHVVLALRETPTTPRMYAFDLNIFLTKDRQSDPFCPDRTARRCRPLSR
jgi:hypothetical protein